MKKRLPLLILLASLAALVLIGGAALFRGESAALFRGESVDLGDMGVLPSRAYVRGGTLALQRLSAALKQHPNARSFSIRWRGIDNRRGEIYKYELRYNRFAGTLDYMDYREQQNPVIACEKVHDASIHLAASDKEVVSGKIDWIVPFSQGSRGGSSCQNKQEVFR